MAFSASFTDGSQAILVFTVPEPATAALMAIASIGVLGRRRAGP